MTERHRERHLNIGPIVSWLNPALIERRIYARRIEELGGRVVFLGDGFNIRLGRIFNESLLGSEPDQSTLSSHEKDLRNLPRGEYIVITISDLDGVYTDPLGAIFSREKRNIPLGHFRILREIIKASDFAFLVTSRIDPDLFGKKFPIFQRLVAMFKRSGIYNFPFCNSSAVIKLRRLSRGKFSGNELVVQVGKPLNIERRVAQLEEIIRDCTGGNRDSSSNDIDNINDKFVVYIIGSSHSDREAVLRLCQRNPQWAKRIVFFDTGHLLI